MEASGSRGTLLRIASHCADRDKFLLVFCRFADEKGIFIPTRLPKAQGTEARFAITIAGGEAVLAGFGRVAECFSDKQNRFKRPGMRIEFSRIDEASRKTLGLLVAAKGSSAPIQSSECPPRGERHLRENEISRGCDKTEPDSLRLP